MGHSDIDTKSMTVLEAGDGDVQKGFEKESNFGDARDVPANSREGMPVLVGPERSSKRGSISS